MFFKKKQNNGQPKKLPKKKKPLWRNILGWIVYLVLIMVIVVGVPKFLSWYLDTNSPMAAITSGSMWPVLKQGDLVFIKGVYGKNDIAIGDIVVYKNETNNTLTIHRVTEMLDDTLITKGDANFTSDEPATYSDVMGKTFNIGSKPARIPWMGNITMYASGFTKVNSN